MNIATSLTVLHFATIALAAWVALRAAELHAGVVLRLALALVLSAAAQNLVDLSAGGPVLALVLHAAAVVVAWREARAFPLFRRVVATSCATALPFPDFAPAITFDDFRRSAA